MIDRFLDISKNVKHGKVLLLMGPRRVGKTTLLDDFLKKSKVKYKKYDGNNISVRDIFSQSEISFLKDYIDGFDVLAIDEAQNIKNIGETLKTIVDARPKLKVIATGSSSFDLIGQVGEPLFGRKTTCYLFPFIILSW
jgi:predicted AAA+ superfamily ATPase